MANQPLVSIGVPAFKTVFLKEAITSLLRQTYTNIEVVIVNDCSPYPVRDIVEQFGDSRIRYFENEKNVGKNDPQTIGIGVWNIHMASIFASCATMTSTTRSLWKACWLWPQNFRRPTCFAHGCLTLIKTGR